MSAAIPSYMEHEIKWDRERMWWVVTRGGAFVTSAPTSGSIREDARAIEHRLEQIEHAESFDGYDDRECDAHPAGPFDPMGETVYCDGSCRP